MTIQDLTIKEAKQKLKEYKELQELFNIEPEQPTKQKSTSNLFDRYIGKYVICRTRNEGINAGYVEALDNTGVILKEARRLYYHRPSNQKLSWYEGVALEGLSSDSKIGAPVEKVLVEDYSLTVCSSVAENSIKGMVTNEQN